MEFVENKGISMAGRLHLSHEWGRRAEDPFRGLRAGPVRFSPITFAAESHRATPQHPGNLKKSAKVVCFFSFEARKPKPFKINENNQKQKEGGWTGGTGGPEQE